MGTETPPRSSVEISEPFLDEDKHIQSDLETIPEWKDQITFRGLVVSALLGTLFCIITHKLNLTVGIIPSLNVAAGLLGFFCVKSWTTFLNKLGFSVRPFTRQENTVIQTCVVACYGLAFSGGFGSYLLSMDERTYNLIGADYPGNRAEDVKDPGLLWMMGFIFVVSFLGLFSLVPLRKVMVMDYKLTYPSGTATAMLINSFHTTTGAELARKQVSSLGKYLSISFVWSCFKWFFSGVGDSCGFDNFPSFGLMLFKNTFYFDFSPTYVGCGLICPHIVNCSVLFGAIISWGALWPYITTRAGDWYPADLGSNDFKGLYGYKVFIAIALILGDGLYNLIKIIAISVKAVWTNSTKQQQLPVMTEIPDSETSISQVEEKKRDAVFLKDNIPTWFAASGYVVLVGISMATMPLIFPPLKWYLVLCSYIIAPALAFCNSYGTGLTDWSLASTYGKIGLFIIASLVGSNGGVLAGLAACGVMMSIVATAADLMQDFKTGYLTFSSAKSMFLSQLVGTAMGCIIAPLTFWMFWCAFEIGTPDSPYKAPYAVIYREMAILGVEGFSELPKHCLALCCGFFVVALGLNLARDWSPKKVAGLIPIPMAMAVPFYIGAYFAIDMFVGTVILFVWERVNKKDAEDYAGAVASGLICGDGIWTIPSAILSIMRIDPPICMYFGPSVESVNKHGILLEVVQVLTDLDLVIIKAYISSDGGWFMDVFNVICRDGTKISDQGMINYIKEVLENDAFYVPSLNGSVGLKPSQDYTVIELAGTDRPGLLSEVSAVLTDLGCNVLSAEIWTHNARAAAVVHVIDDKTRCAVEDPKRLSTIQKLLCNVLKGNNDLKAAKMTLSTPGFMHRQRRLHQIMFAERDYDKEEHEEKENRSSLQVTVLDCAEKGYTVITMLCRDRPKLLFDTICTLTDMEYIVFHGVVHTGKMEAYQEYYIRHVDGTPLSSEAERERVMQCLEAAIERRTSEEAVELELCTEDRVGLLSDITRIFRENSLCIKRAEISTEGGKAMDKFYVTDMTGNGPVDPKTIDSIRREMGQDTTLDVRWKCSEFAKPPAEETGMGFLFGNLFKFQTLKLVGSYS